ncbi:MAG: zinc ribbon domain-containing protein [Lentisphaeria bacterium]|nr:zinc ribbon domain-containing protein [Lentisphaeria bacterium]
MPTYEYKCEQCGVQFDHFQSMTSEPLQTCQKCGGKLRRLIGEGAGIIFKGKGFYCTDYRSNNSVSSESHEPKTAGNEAAKSDSAAKSAGAADAAKTPAAKSGAAAS